MRKSVAAGCPSRRLIRVLLLAACWLATGTAQAAGPHDGKTIQSIQVDGLVLLSQETLLYYLDLAVGKPLDPAALDAKIHDLWKRQLVDDVSVDAVADGEGVRLAIRVKERPVLRSVSYKGLKRLAKTDIDDRLAKEQVDLREGRPLPRGELARVESIIEDMYREKGYRFAQVTAVLDEVEKGTVTATVTVDEGDRVRIGDIDFEGNEVFGDLRLRWVMKNTKESGLVTRFLKKDIYNPAKLEEDLVKVRDLYRGAGYKNVLVGDPRTEVREKGSKRRLVLVIPIDEGERWRFGKVTVAGNQRFTSETVLSLITLKEGGWLRSDVIDDAVEKIKQSYDNSGYIFSRVDPVLVERDGYVADLELRITESDQFRVGRIEFEGNTSTRDKVLRRELRVQEGLFVNLGGVKNSVYKVNQLGFYKLEEGEPVKFDADNEKKLVNLTFAGKEDNRTELQFGAGYSDTLGFFGQLSFRTFNFMGRGETVGVSFESGSRRDVYDVSYFVPWFLDKPQSVGAQLAQTRLEYFIAEDRFVQDSLGGTLSFSRSFGLFQSLGVSYSLQRYTSEIFDRGTDGGTTVIDGGTINTSAIQPVWTYNSIDNRFEPTRGQRIRGSFQYAGGVLGGNNWLTRTELSYTLFQPVTGYPVRTVFGFNVEAGRVDPFGTERNDQGVRVDRTLNRLERYFLGGENSIRGHSYRSIFVRDDDGNLVPDPLVSTIGYGGDEYLQVNVEYHFLLGGPFRLIVFADGGNVFGDFVETETVNGQQQSRLVKQSIDFNNLRWTAGAELRLLVPVFGAPLRFIYTTQLDDELPGDDFETFRFSIGASF